MRTINVLLGTIAGLSVGAVVSILFAPEKGSTTRKQIMEKSRDYVDKLKSTFNESFDSLKDNKSTKEVADKPVDKRKFKFSGDKNDVKNSADKFKKESVSDRFDYSYK